LKGHLPKIVHWKGTTFDLQTKSDSSFFLFAVEKGHGQLHIDNRISDFAEGDFLFLVPHNEQRARVSSKEMCKLICLDFSPEGLGDPTFFDHFVSDMLNPALKNVISHQADEADDLLRIITEIDMILENKETDRYLLLKSKTLELLYYLRRHFDGTGQFVTSDPDKTRKYNRLLPTLTYIQKNIHLNHSVPSLAHYSNFSTSRFSHLFSEVMGRPVGDYLVEIRMEKAKTLLNSSSLSLDQLAASLGLSSAKVLTRQFKAYFNMTPSNYCKS